MPDDVLEQAQGGDNDAFAALIAPHLTAMTAYARSLCGEAATAEDVVQDSAIIAYTNLHRLFPDADFRTWLKAIVRRQALAAGRKRQRLGPLLSDNVEDVFEIEDDDLEEERLALHHCLPQLGQRMGAVVEAFYHQGESINAIARRLDSKPNSVKTLLHRARAALRRCMEQQLRPGART